MRADPVKTASPLAKAIHIHHASHETMLWTIERGFSKLYSHMTIIFPSDWIKRGIFVADDNAVWSRILICRGFIPDLVKDAICCKSSQIHAMTYCLLKMISHFVAPVFAMSNNQNPLMTLQNRGFRLDVYV